MHLKIPLRPHAVAPSQVSDLMHMCCTGRVLLRLMEAVCAWFSRHGACVVGGEREF